MYSFSNEKTYEKFVKQGKLVAVRCAIDAIRDVVLQEISQMDPGTRSSLLSTYINQLKFDTLIDSNLVLRWMKCNAKNSDVLKLPLPRKWIESIQENLELGELRLKQGKIVYFQKLLKLQLRSIGRTILLLFTSKEKSCTLEFFKVKNLSVLGHVEDMIGSDSQAEGRWNYETWNNRNGVHEKNVNFFPELNFMQILLVHYLFMRRFRGIKGRAHFFGRSMRQFFEYQGSVLDRCMALDQIFFNELVGLACQAEIPMQIQFTESMGCRRPYWTYEAENRGVDVEFRFFANYATLSTGSRIELPPQFSLYSWGRITTVSNWQVNSLPRLNALGMKIDIKRTDIPWFVDQEDFKFQDLERFLVVFDYERKKSHFGYSTLNDLGLSDPECNIKFLETILEVCSTANILVYHKRKRQISRKSQLVNYEEIFAKDSYRDIYRTIPAGVSPHRIVSGAVGAISLPPTSTGLIGREMGVPSIYFDPTGNVSKHDPALDSVTLINSKEGLSQWIDTLKGTS